MVRSNQFSHFHLPTFQHSHQEMAVFNGKNSHQPSALWFGESQKYAHRQTRYPALFMKSDVNLGSCSSCKSWAALWVLKGMKHPQRAFLFCQLASPICPLPLPSHLPYLLMRGKTCQLQQPDYWRPMPVPPNLPSIKISRQRLRRARETWSLTTLG